MYPYDLFSASVGEITSLLKQSHPKGIFRVPRLRSRGRYGFLTHQSAILFSSWPFWGFPFFHPALAPHLIPCQGIIYLSNRAVQCHLLANNLWAICVSQNSKLLIKHLILAETIRITQEAANARPCRSRTFFPEQQQPADNRGMDFSAGLQHGVKLGRRMTASSFVQ